MSNVRLGNIDFVTTADSHGAFWRGPADTEATLLCSVKAGAVADPEVREKFHALAAAVAGHHVLHGSAAIGVAPPAPWWSSLPCARCESPVAADVRHLCGQVTELSELQLSPSGLPVVCCRIHVAGAMGVPNMPPAAAPPRRSRRWF
jgi:hypothetical protein